MYRVARSRIHNTYCMCREVMSSKREYISERLEALSLLDRFAFQFFFGDNARHCETDLTRSFVEDLFFFFFRRASRN